MMVTILGVAMAITAGGAEPTTEPSSVIPETDIPPITAAADFRQENSYIIFIY
jgi:hypothetical protein